MKPVNAVAFRRPEAEPGELAWWQRAACRGASWGVFFPDQETQDGVALAKALCARCPVRQECLDDALAYQAVGVWGGTTTAERRALRAQRRGRGGHQRSPESW